MKHEEEEEGNKWRPPTPPRDLLSKQPSPIKKPSHSRSTFSPPLSTSPETRYMKGFETWTIEEDKILMAHVLTRLSGCRWNEAQLKLKNKHTAEDCEKRWEILKDLLIRGAAKTGTRGW